MKRVLHATALLLLAVSIPGCSGTYVGVRARHYPWGYGYGRAPYYGPGWGRTVIVAPPDGGGRIDPDFEVPPPDGAGGIDPDFGVPPPDLGMPDFGPMDMGDLDMGGFDL